MKAKIKLKPRVAKQVESKPVTEQAESIRPVDLLGRRWCAGESIRKLANEAGVPWNELQSKLRAAGYLRSHRGVVVPN